MIKIDNFYSPKELKRYYDFVLSQKPSIVTKKGKGTAIVSLLNSLPQNANPKIKIASFYELLTMNFSELKKFCDSLATESTTYKKLIDSRKNDLRIYKKYYSEFFHKIDENYGIRNNMLLIKELGVTVCPYCNRNYINSRKTRIGANFDHYYDKSTYPFFALTLSNLIPCCTTCNTTKTTGIYEYCPFDLEKREKVLFKISSPGNYSRIKLYFGSKSQAENKLELEEAYQIHESDIDEMFRREEEYCKQYRKSLAKLLENGNSENNITESFFDTMIYGEIARADFNDYLNRPLSKLKKDTYDYIVELRHID